MAPRVLLFGRREWTDTDTIRRRLERFPYGTVVIHGASRGADSPGGEVARELGFHVVEEPVTGAEWKTRGRRAGLERNKRMPERHRPTCGLGPSGYFGCCAACGLSRLPQQFP